MYPNHTDKQAVSQSTDGTARRPFLRSMVGAGVLGSLGLARLPTARGIPGVTIELKRCKVAFVSNASALDTIAVYYADRDRRRRAVYRIDPTTTDARRYAPLRVNYNAGADRTIIQITERRASLVCVIADAGTARAVRTNPTGACVPTGFNSPPTASFGISVLPTVGEPVTFTSTATDPDSPERLFYEWDLDGDGTYETVGQEVTTSYLTTGDRTVAHRVTDDCGETDTATQIVTVEAVRFGQVTELTGSFWFGYSVAIAGDTLAVADPGIVYLYDLTDLSAQPLELAPSGASNEFGWTMAAAGDTLAVGDNSSLSGPSAVYVYDLADLSAPPRKLVSPGPDDDLFGSVSIAIAGDTLAVGATGDDDAGRNAGAVYVYDLTDLSAQPQKLVPNSLNGGDTFGVAVSISGDILAVGAPRDDDAGEDAGAVYLYFLPDLSVQPVKLAPVDELGDRDNFGSGVAIAGDTLVGGAPAAGRDGAAYVYDLTERSLRAQKLVPDTLEFPGSRFGRQAAVAGDTIVVTAPSEARPREEPLGPLSSVGAVYVYDRTDLSAPRTKLSPDSLREGAFFGWSVALTGDALAAGAIGDGWVYVFQ
jgi:PKD repeat protein